MKELSQHKVWALWLAAALIMIVAAYPLLGMLEHLLAGQAKANAQVQREMTLSLQKLREDADMARKLGVTMDESMVSAMLAPANRSKATTMLEQMAAASDFSRFTYTLAPEKPVTDNAVASTATGLVTSTITIQTEAPEDLSVYRFISNLQKTIPGRIKLQQLRISRVHAERSSELGHANMQMSAKIEWLTNTSNEGTP